MDHEWMEDDPEDAVSRPRIGKKHPPVRNQGHCMARYSIVNCNKGMYMRNNKRGVLVDFHSL